MFPIDRWVSGWLMGFLTGVLATGLILAVVFAYYELKRRRVSATRMRNF